MPDEQHTPQAGPPPGPPADPSSSNAHHATAPTPACLACDYPVGRAETLAARTCSECGAPILPGDDRASLARQQILTQKHPGLRRFLWLTVATLAFGAIRFALDVTTSSSANRWFEGPGLVPLILSAIALAGIALGPPAVFIVSRSRHRPHYMRVWLAHMWLIPIPFAVSIAIGTLLLMLRLVFHPALDGLGQTWSFIGFIGFLFWAVACLILSAVWLRACLRTLAGAALLTRPTLIESIAWVLSGVVCWTGASGLGFGLGAAAISELAWSNW